MPLNLVLLKTPPKIRLPQKPIRTRSPFKHTLSSVYVVILVKKVINYHLAHGFSKCLPLIVRNVHAKKHVCFDCLHPGQNAGACTSKFTCRERKLQHHSLLHREKPSTASNQKFVSKRNAQPNLGTASTSDVKPNCNEAQGNQHAEGLCAKATNTSNVFLSTAFVKIRNQSGKGIQMRARRGSQGSFITESNAKALMLNTIRTQTPISPIGSLKAQKTLGVLPTRLNQTNDTSVHIIPKITNTLPMKHIDISQSL